MVNGSVIGLYSSLPMSGKSTAAAALTSANWKRLPFAATLKKMTRILLLDLGQSEQEVEASIASQKELPCILLPSRTPRQIMQTLGTDWGRDMIDQDIWIKCWKGQAVSALGDGFNVVVDDVRRHNEAQVIKDFGGLMVKVVRPDGGSEAFSGHASEGGLEDWPFDHTLVNDGTIADLERQILALVDTLKQQRSDGPQAD